MEHNYFWESTIVFERRDFFPWEAIPYKTCQKKEMSGLVEGVRHSLQAAPAQPAGPIPTTGWSGLKEPWHDQPKGHVSGSQP